MRLDERPAIDQLLDPKGPVYCGQCGREKPDHAPSCQGLVLDKLAPPPGAEGEA